MDVALITAAAAAAAAMVAGCQVVSNWSVAGRLQEVPGSYIAAALLPALIITVLFYFDHSEYNSSQR
jgi:membrane protein DedA with SNARE-associated domain